MKLFLLFFLIIQQIFPHYFHKEENEFYNPFPTFQNPGIFNKLKMIFDLIWNQDPHNNPNLFQFEYKLPLIEPNVSGLHLTWIGHSSFLLQMEGLNILLDPVWKECLGPCFFGFKRYTRPGIKLEDLPKIDLILISHHHIDHFDLESIEFLIRRDHPSIFMGLKSEVYFKNSEKTPLYTMDWWENRVFKTVKIYFLPSQHSSDDGLWGHNQTLWGGFMIMSQNRKVYFAGDTGFFSELKKISEYFHPIDLALLPIGAYKPQYYLKPFNMKPNEASKAFKELRADFFIPMHYQTYQYSLEKIDEPLKQVKQELEAAQLLNKLQPLLIGETYIYE